MMNSKSAAKPAGALMGLVAALFFSLGTVGTASAHPMEGHGGMGEDYGHGMGHGMGHGGMSLLKPHNAAAHFLKMGPMLNLTDSQTQQLVKLRDQYIENNAKTEEMLQAAYSDLARAMFSDQTNVQQTMGIVNNIGKMESQLWQSYLQQLQDIRNLLTAQQKQSLKDMWKNPHHGMKGEMDDEQEGMSDGHGNKPMGEGDMNQGHSM